MQLLGTEHTVKNVSLALRMVVYARSRLQEGSEDTPCELFYNIEEKEVVREQSRKSI